MKKITCILFILLSVCPSIWASAVKPEFKKTSLKASEDDLQLSVLYSLPSSDIEPKGILQLVHGMCEYKERYRPFMEYMSRNGWICIIHDHRGHGESVRHPNELGYFYDGGYQAMIKDVKIVTDWIQQKYPGLKISMLGHSMGSMVARSFAKNYDASISALIVCGSPSYDPASGFGVALTRNIMKKYGGMSRPRKIQKVSFNSFNRKYRHEGSPNAWICSDISVVEAYDKDPLCSFQFTANGFYNLFSLMQYTYDKNGWNIQNPELRIHFISGEDDPCLGNEKKFGRAVEFMRSAGYRQVTSHLYPGMRHEILNEKGKERVWNDILDHLAQTGNPSPSSN